MTREQLEHLQAGAFRPAIKSPGCQQRPMNGA
jgi:hypothetical protein